MNFKFIASATIAALSVSSAFAQPSADAILQGARVAATLTRVEDGILGSLTKDGKKTPIQLFLREKEIQFQFLQGDWKFFHMRLDDNSYDLFQVAEGGKATRFPDSKITEAIAGSDLTYEDLALRFFYWPNPTLEGQEDVNGQPCYKLRVNKPKGVAGRYDTVYIWVHVKFGAFMQIKGYNKGSLLKEFSVEDVMQIGGGVWTLQKMLVATYDPKSGRRASITHVVFDQPKKAGPRGTR